MNPTFAALVESLQPKLDRLLAMPHLRYGNLPKDMPTSGVYLFTENSRHLYVGRSNVLRARYGRHCRVGATHRQAAFAFLLARETTGRTMAAYRTGEDSRAGLMLDPKFAAAFSAAKRRIQKWNIVTWRRRTRTGKLCWRFTVRSRLPHPTTTSERINTLVLCFQQICCPLSARIQHLSAARLLAAAIAQAACISS